MGGRCCLRPAKYPFAPTSQNQEGNGSHYLNPNVTTWDIGQNHTHAVSGEMVDYATGAPTGVISNIPNGS